MTATSSSLVFLGCFVALLVWGADGVIDEHLTVKPAATTGYHPMEMTTANTSYGESALPFECRDTSHKCPYICDICNQMEGAPTMTCLSVLYSDDCVSPFESEMMSLNSSDWCIWGKVKGLYSNLSYCTEEICDCLNIPWPNRLVEETFVDIHSRFFADCPIEELSDPPPFVVFALVITPICLIPVMVILVMVKTKNEDAS